MAEDSNESLEGLDFDAPSVPSDNQISIKENSQEYDFGSGVDALFAAEDPDALPESENVQASENYEKTKAELGRAGTVKKIIPVMKEKEPLPELEAVEPAKPSAIKRVSDVRRATLTDLVGILKALGRRNPQDA